MAEEELAPSEVPEESEFDEAFAEFGSAKDGTTEPSEEEELPAAAASAEPDDNEDESADEPDAVEEPDPYEGMDDVVKARYQELEANNDKLTHQLKSDAGRVSAFQRQVNQLQNQISEIREGSTAGDQPTENQIKDAMMGGDDEWEKFAEDYPAVASAIDKRFESGGSALQTAVDNVLTPVKETITKIDTEAGQTAAQKRIDAVAEEFPTWTEAVETPEFKLWLDNQPPGVQGLAFSDDTRDASSLIGMYDDHLVADGQPSLRKDPTEPGVEEEEVVAEGSEGPTELEKRRQQQLDAGASIPSKPAGIDASAEATTEFDAAFAQFARKKDQARQSA